MVGYLGYDIVRRLEKIGPTATRDDLRLPELTMLLATDLAVLDHCDGTVLLIANAINHDDSTPASTRPTPTRWPGSTRWQADLAAPGRPAARPSLPPSELPEYTAPWGGRRLPGGRRGVKEHIRAGEAFQIVLASGSRCRARRARWTSTGCCAPPTRARTCTCSASDGVRRRRLVARRRWSRSTDGRAMLHPIAGTRPRGATPEEDAALADELLADPKERAEHLMLVDLGRNDLGRVCAPGTRRGRRLHVGRALQPRHAHRLDRHRPGRAPAAPPSTCSTACFPAGTLSGAPKPRAMEIIEELEPTRRGLYGGCVGYLDFAGDADTAIAIRTALLRDGTAYVQAGAGIVADSDPVAEDAGVPQQGGGGPARGPHGEPARAAGAPEPRAASDGG